MLILRRTISSKEVQHDRLSQWAVFVSLVVYQTEILISFIFFHRLPSSGVRWKVPAGERPAAHDKVDYQFAGRNGNNGVLNVIVTALLNRLFDCLCFQNKVLFMYPRGSSALQATPQLSVQMTAAYANSYGSAPAHGNRSFRKIRLVSYMCFGILLSRYFRYSYLFKLFLDSHYQTVNDRTGMGTADGVNDMPVGSADGKRTNRLLGCEIIN